MAMLIQILSAKTSGIATGKNRWSKLRPLSAPGSLVLLGTGGNHRDTTDLAAAGIYRRAQVLPIRRSFITGRGIDRIATFRF